jgi:hypothetical protein
LDLFDAGINFNLRYAKTITVVTIKSGNMWLCLLTELSPGECFKCLAKGMLQLRKRAAKMVATQGYEKGSSNTDITPAKAS